MRLNGSLGVTFAEGNLEAGFTLKGCFPNMDASVYQFRDTEGTHLDIQIPGPLLVLQHQGRVIGTLFAPHMGNPKELRQILQQAWANWKVSGDTTQPRDFLIWAAMHRGFWEGPIVQLTTVEPEMAEPAITPTTVPLAIRDPERGTPRGVLDAFVKKLEAEGLHGMAAQWPDLVDLYWEAKEILGQKEIL